MVTKKARQFLNYFILIVLLLLTLFPAYWVISTSFKPQSEWFVSPVHWLPARPTLSNYEQAFTNPLGSKAITNSVLAALGGTTLALLVGYPAAYSLSRYRGGRVPLFILPLILRTSPPAVIVIPLIVFYSSVGFVDTLHGLILVYGGTTAFYVIWMIKPFIDAIPRDIEDAAMVDGVSRWTIPFRVVMPLVASGVAAAVIFAFILNWTEFFYALSLTRFETRTIPVHMATISALGAVSTGQGQAAAVSTISLVPFLVGAYYFQRYLLRAFTYGFAGRR